MKKPKKRSSIRSPEVTGVGPLDWTPLFGAFREAFEWALDVAVALAKDFPEEVDAVERVRTFMRARIAGQPSHVRADDVLFTFGLIIGAIERDLGPVAALGPWFAPVMHFPGSAERWDPWDLRVPPQLLRALRINSTLRPYA